MKVVLTGAGGQLGAELLHTAPPQHEIVALGHSDLDLTDGQAIDDLIAETGPGAVINTAAYTRVDDAEENEATAFAVNAEGSGRLAAAAQATGARTIHISTDFVFGDGSGSPLRPDDPTSPLGVYGASKLEGERRVVEATGGTALVMRTAWLYSRHGSNFVLSMLERMRAGQELGVVSDQIGTPTWARGLARAVWRALARELSGIHHWTDAGVASWYDFAVAIQDEALDLGLLAQPAPVHPVATSDYPTPAHRPEFSVLDKTATWEALGSVPVHWRRALRTMLGELESATDV